jgi:uncharacterized protein YtpQ (UPF0354 family)
MKLWPFSKKSKSEPTRAESALTSPEPEISAMDRLLSRNCSRDEFLLLYLKLLQERMPGATMQMLNDSTVKILRPSGKEFTAFMDNAWIAYSRSTDDRRELLERYAAAMNEGPEEGVEKERIIAIVKDSEYMSHFKPEHRPACEHLCGDLWVIYAQDFPDRTTSLKLDHLEAAGIPQNELRHIALENLRLILPEAQRHGDGPWYLLTAGGDYTASLLLFDRMWDELADSVEGDLVAVVPSRDVLLYTGSNSVQVLAAIRERAAKILATGNYLVSDSLIVRRDGKWEVFKAN